MSHYINIENIEKYLGENESDFEFKRSIVETFLTLTEQQLAELFNCMQKNDTGRVIFISHKLKSSSSLVGAEKLSSAFEEVEKLAGTENEPQLSELFKSLTDIFAETKKCLNEYLAK